MILLFIFTVVFVGARHTRQSQDVKTEYESEEFHWAKIFKNVLNETIKFSTTLSTKQLKRWRLHSFDFAFGWACVLTGKGKCVQCGWHKKKSWVGFFLFFFLRLPFKAVSVRFVKSAKNVD